ncbi:MAG: ABC-2 transporter permease [Candidatus Hydrogenedentes bacterium]|nr:ABC-2 transporter permease [Candidatus Hydrogenedentota bacterium]
MTVRALLWKDLRIFTDVFAAGIALLLGSYFLAFLLVYSGGAKEFSWSSVFAGGASLARFTSILISALLGAYAFAYENEDRSSLFLASLPADRRTIVFSKALIAVSAFAMIWLTSLTVLLTGMRAMGVEWSTLKLVLEGMVGYAASGAMAFGVSWALSLKMASPVGAALAGLVSLMPVYLLQIAANEHFGIENPMFFHPIALVLMTCACFAGVGSGGIAYIRTGGVPQTETRRRWQRARTVAWELGELQTPKAASFHALLWKDAALLSTSFRVGVAVVAAPYLVVLTSPDKATVFRGASLVAAALLALVASFWSGHLMSAESTSRTGESLAYLPARRSTRIFARLSVLLTPVSTMSLLNLGILLTANSAIPGSIRLGANFTWTNWQNAPYLIIGMCLANAGLVGCSLSWLVSAKYRRPAMAIVVGVMTAFSGMAVFGALSSLCVASPDILTPTGFVACYTAGSLGISSLLFGLGSVQGDKPN